MTLLEAIIKELYSIGDDINVIDEKDICLSLEEKMIIIQRASNKTFKEIGELINKTSETTRQHYYKAVKKIRKYNLKQG